MALNLGSVNFGLGVDDSSMRKGLIQIVRFGAKVEAAAKKSGKASKAIAEGLRRQEEAALKAVQAVASLNQQARKASITQKAQNAVIKSATRAYLDNVTALTSGKLSTLEFSRVQSKFTADLGRTRRQLQRYQANMRDTAEDTKDFSEQVRNLSATSVLAVGPLSGIGARINALGSIANRSGLAMTAMFAGIAAGIVTLTKLSYAAVKVAFDLDQVRARLTATADTMQEANAEFINLRKLASDAGVSFVVLSNSFAKIKAAAKGTGLENSYRQIFEDITISAAQFRLSVQETEGVLKAFEQIMSKGTVQAEELRGQLGDRLPGAFTIAARAMGMTTSELNSMLKQGKILAEDFLPKFARELRKTLGSDQIRSVNSLQASYQRFQDSLMFFNSAFDETFGISRKLKIGLEAITGVVRALEGEMQIFSKVLVLATGGMLGIVGPGIVKGFLVIIRLLKSATVAMIAFNAATLANPMGAIATVIGRVAIGLAAAGAALIAFGSTAKASESDFDSYKQSIDEYIKSLKIAEKSQADIARERMTFVKTQIENLQAKITEMKAIRDALAQMQSMPEQRRQNVHGFQQADIKDTSDTKFAEAAAKLKKLKEQYDELVAALQRMTKATREAEAARKKALEDSLANLRLEIDRMKARSDAILEGGNALQKLNDQFERTDAIKRFRDEVIKVVSDVGIAAAMTEEFTKAWDSLKASEQTQQLLKAGEALDTLRGRLEAASQGVKALKEYESKLQLQSKIEAFRKSLENTALSQAAVNEKVAEFISMQRQLEAFAKGERMAAALSAAKDQIQELTDRLTASRGGIASLKKFEDALDMQSTIKDFENKLAAAGWEGQQLRNIVDQLTNALRQLNLEAQLSNMDKAFDNAEVRIAEIKRTTEALKGSTDQFNKFRSIERINSEVDSLVQSYQEAGISMDITATAASNLREALFQQLKAQEAFDKRNKGGSAKEQQKRIENMARINTELVRMSETLVAMDQGPKVFENLNQQFERSDAIEAFRKRLDEVGYSEEVATEKLKLFIEQFDAIKGAQKKLDELGQVWDVIGQSMEDTFMSIVDGTMSVKDAFKAMARDIIKELYRVLIVQRAVNAITGFFQGGNSGNGGGGFNLLGGLFGGKTVPGILSSADGNAFGRQGVINAPAAFNYGGNKLGTIAEQGPETILPLARGSDGKLGVISQGGNSSSTNFNVTQNFSIQATSDETFDKMLAKRMPAIMNAAMLNIVDKYQRGQLNFNRG